MKPVQRVADGPPRENCSNDTPSKAASQPNVITVYLRNIPLFKDLGSEQLEILGASLQTLSVVPGKVVIRTGASIEHLYILLSGRLQVFAAIDSDATLELASVLPGEFFGDLAIVDGMPAINSVVAQKPSLIALLPRADALNLMFRNPLIAERMLKRFAANVRAATKRHAILTLPSAFQRVVALLNQYATTAPGGLVIIEKLPKQQEIASIVNTSRETVSRAIQALVQQGVIEKDVRRLIVRSPDVLRQAAPDEKAVYRAS